MVLVAALAGCGGDSGLDVTAVAAPGNARIEALAADCAADIGGDGFGSATIDRELIISNETGEIGVPCRILLIGGGELKLNNVHLTARHLVLRDDDQAAAQTIQFDNSELTGAPDSGFLLDLHDEGDAVAIHNTVIAFDRSVWIRVVGNRDDQVGGGRLTVTNSTMRSTGAGTQGIQLVAGDSHGGRAVFNSLTLDTPGDVVLLAEDCKANGLIGAPPECGPLPPPTP